jgi:hypothetical protein
MLPASSVHSIYLQCWLDALRLSSALEQIDFVEKLVWSNEYLFVRRRRVLCPKFRVARISNSLGFRQLGVCQQEPDLDRAEFTLLTNSFPCSELETNNDKAAAHTLLWFVLATARQGALNTTKKKRSC